MKRPLVLFLLFLLPAAALPAQEKEPSWIVRAGQFAWRLVTGPNQSLDSVYVLQPELLWTVALESDFIYTGADLHSGITLSDFTGESGQIYRGTMDTGMKNMPYRKVGLAAGFGSLRIGYGLNLAKTKGNQDKYFNLGLYAPSYGAQIRCHTIYQYPSGTLAMEGFEPIDLSSDYPGETRSLVVDAYYCINRHRFVYTATDNARIIQRRSAGSWMVTAKFLQGEFSLNQDDPLVRETLKGMRGYSTRQFSVGGGYSFNWVPLHRDPAKPETAGGLQNLTLNATVLPMISFLNHVQTEEETEKGEQHVRINGQPAFCPTLRGAVCYTLGRWSFSAETTYSRFGFQGVDTEISEENDHLRTKVTTRGTFYEWSVKGNVNFRF